MYLNAIAVCIGLLCTYLEVWHSDILDNSSALAIIWLQSYSTRELDIIFEVIGEITAVLFIVIGGMIYLTYNKVIGLAGIYSGFLGASVSGTMKIVLLHSRPFWEYENIKVIGCPTDWGSPSGHATSGSSACIVIGYFWLKQQVSLSAKILCLSIYLLITAIDRVYLGAHFYFQVLLGYSYGFIIALYIIRQSQAFYRFYNDFTYVFIEHIKITLYSMVSLGIYMLHSPHVTDITKKNYYHKCSKHIYDDKVSIKNLTEAFYLWIVAGVVMGLYLNKNKYKTELTWVSGAASLVLFAGSLGYIVIFEKLLMKFVPVYIGLSISVFNRYFTGIFISYGLPRVVQMISKKTLKLKQ
jgi:membrane-associated phospholipid phosphatase